MAMNNSLAKVHPELVSEWSEKNLTLTPGDITFGSNKKVWWRSACGHEWQASVKARSNGEKCPICSGARVIAGESHYPLGKMLGLAFDGITSLSIKPIRIITGIGTFISLLSFLAIIWTFIMFYMKHSVVGWSSTISIICFIGGVQLICLGVLGEYIGKIYMEVKHRPRYIISDRTWEEKER